MAKCWISRFPADHLIQPLGVDPLLRLLDLFGFLLDRSLLHRSVGTGLALDRHGEPGIAGNGLDTVQIDQPPGRRQEPYQPSVHG